MRGVDNIQPFIPTHRVQRPGEKGKRRDPGTGKEKGPHSKIRPEHQTDRGTHVVDEFA